MLDHPGMVRKIHEDYFNAGAIVATTNTYAIHQDRLERFDLDHLFHALQLRALVASAWGLLGKPGCTRTSRSVPPG